MSQRLVEKLAIAEALSAGESKDAQVFASPASPTGSQYFTTFIGVEVLDIVGSEGLPSVGAAVAISISDDDAPIQQRRRQPNPVPEGPSEAIY